MADPAVIRIFDTTLRDGEQSPGATMTTGEKLQVAEKLVISPRTVNGHLRSIYTKINVKSRSAATHYAMEHHLLNSNLPSPDKTM